MIKLDIFNQPLIVARKNRGSADMFPKGFSLPFEISFHAIGGFVRELYGFIHAAGLLASILRHYARMLLFCSILGSELEVTGHRDTFAPHMPSHRSTCAKETKRERP